MSYILPAIWARAEQLFFEGETTLEAIALDCGMARSTLSRRAKLRGWPPHNKLELDSGSSERARLRRAIARKLVRLEQRMEQPESDADSASDSERQAREFGSLMTTVEKLDAKESAWKRSLITTPAEVLPAPALEGEKDHVAQWRAELARRLARLPGHGPA